MYGKIRRYGRMAYNGAKKYGPTALKVAKFALMKPKTSAIGRLLPKPDNRIESKYNEALINATAVDNTGAYTVLFNGLSISASSIGRIGQQICNKNLCWRAQIQRATTTPLDTSLRIIIFYDKQTNGSLPVWTTLMDITSIVSLYSMDNKDRFVVLSDKQYSVNSNQTQIMDKGFINLKRVSTRYDTGNTGAVADIITGGIFALAISNTSVVASQPLLTFSWRLKFTDQ